MTRNWITVPVMDPYTELDSVPVEQGKHTAVQS